jgi:molybdopterin-guanine dinucleotide biosynthesis protein B
MVMKVVSFVAASSNSGKTTLIVKIVRILKERGLRVAVIKHASKGFEIDRPGKDSWRFREAGADAVLLIGPDRMALMKQWEREPAPSELEQMVRDVDVVIREGFKGIGGNRIEVYRYGASGDRPLCMDDPTLLAVVSDQRIDRGIPWFDLDDAGGVADFIVAKL